MLGHLWMLVCNSDLPLTLLSNYVIWLYFGYTRTRDRLQRRQVLHLVADLCLDLLLHQSWVDRIVPVQVVDLHVVFRFLVPFYEMNSLFWVALIAPV